MTAVAERVAIDIEGAVATVRMTRTDKHNALDGAMFKGLHAAIDRLAGESAVRVAVLTGEGPSFSSGLDFPSFMSPDSEPSMDALIDRPEGRPENFAQRIATGWSELPIPVIAAVHGNCFGGGLQIALGADIRIAAPDATLSIMEARWGLVPDMGITRSLPRLVGIDVAKELTFTARRISGEEAAGFGLVTRTADDPLEAAQALAEEIASRSPDAVRAAKRLYDEAWLSGPEESLALETELQLKLIGSPNQLEALQAGVEKRSPNFTDPG